MPTSEITKFPINTIEEYATISRKGIGKQLASSIPFNSASCATDCSPSQNAVTTAITATYECPIETVHSEFGYPIDANPLNILAKSGIGADNVLANRTLKKYASDLNNTFEIYDVGSHIEVSASLGVGADTEELWEDDNNLLSSVVFYAMELYTFDEAPEDSSLWFGARNKTPLFCYGSPGNTAGKDYSTILNNDTSLDINAFDSEYLVIKNRNLDIFKAMGTGSFTMSMKFASTIPTNTDTRIPLFKCKNSNNFGYECVLVKSTKTKWGFEITVTGDNNISQTGTYSTNNILDSNWHTISITEAKVDDTIKILVYLDGVEKYDWSIPQLTLWDSIEPSADFILFEDMNYDGAINDLYFFSSSFTVEQLAVLHSARYIGPYNTKLIKSVQGGLNQRCAIVDLSSLVTIGNSIRLFSVLPTEVIGKIFIKAIDSVTYAGQRYSIGTSDDNEKFVSNIDFYYENGTTGFIDSWVYGTAFENSESYYVSTSANAGEEVKLYLNAKDIDTPISGKLAVTMFYDQVNWDPYKLYVMGKIDSSSLNVLRLNLDASYLEYSERCAGITNLNDYATTSWNKNIYCAGGLSTVVGMTNSDYNDYAASIYKYDTANDDLSPMVRCQLSTERRAAGRVGAVSYSMDTGFNRIYFFGGCVNHGIKDVSGTMATDYYETLITIDKFNPSIDTLNAVVNARMSVARVGSTTYTYKNTDIYCVGGFRTEGGSVPAWSNTLYYSNADKMQLATDTVCSTKSFTNLTNTAGVSRMKCVSQNGLIYMIGGGTYPTATGYETSLSTCTEINAANSTAIVLGTTNPYAVSKACRGQDAKFGWIVGGDQADGTSADSIPWTSKFEFATKTFSVADIGIPRSVSNESGESV